MIIKIEQIKDGIKDYKYAECSGFNISENETFVNIYFPDEKDLNIKKPITLYVIENGKTVDKLVYNKTKVDCIKKFPDILPYVNPNKPIIVDEQYKLFQKTKDKLNKDNILKTLFETTISDKEYINEILTMSGETIKDNILLNTPVRELGGNIDKDLESKLINKVSNELERMNINNPKVSRLVNEHKILTNVNGWNEETKENLNDKLKKESVLLNTPVSKIIGDNSELSDIIKLTPEEYDIQLKKRLMDIKEIGVPRNNNGSPCDEFIPEKVIDGKDISFNK